MIDIPPFSGYNVRWEVISHPFFALISIPLWVTHKPTRSSLYTRPDGHLEPSSSCGAVL